MEITASYNIFKSGATNVVPVVKAQPNILHLYDSLEACVIYLVIRVRNGGILVCLFSIFIEQRIGWKYVVTCFRCDGKRCQVRVWGIYFTNAGVKYPVKA